MNPFGQTARAGREKCASAQSVGVSISRYFEGAASHSTSEIIRFFATPMGFQEMVMLASP
jgi:hypothetical protein